MGLARLWVRVRVTVGILLKLSHRPYFGPMLEHQPYPEPGSTVNPIIIPVEGATTTIARTTQNPSGRINKRVMEG